LRQPPVRRAQSAGEERLGPLDAVGTTTVADRARRRSHEVDLVAVRALRDRPDLVAIEPADVYGAGYVAAEF
jgi:hypothetical protein